MSQAYEGGATDDEAVKYGLIAGIAEAGTELMFGGLGKAVGATGLSKGFMALDDKLATKVRTLRVGCCCVCIPPKRLSCLRDTEPSVRTDNPRSAYG